MELNQLWILIITIFSPGFIDAMETEVIMSNTRQDNVCRLEDVMSNMHDEMTMLMKDEEVRDVPNHDCMEEGHDHGGVQAKGPNVGIANGIEMQQGIEHRLPNNSFRSVQEQGQCEDKDTNKTHIMQMKQHSLTGISTKSDNSNELLHSKDSPTQVDKQVNGLAQKNKPLTDHCQSTMENLINITENATTYEHSGEMIDINSNSQSKASDKQSCLVGLHTNNNNCSENDKVTSIPVIKPVIIPACFTSVPNTVVRKQAPTLNTIHEVKGIQIMSDTPSNIHDKLVTNIDVREIKIVRDSAKLQTGSHDVKGIKAPEDSTDSNHDHGNIVAQSVKPKDKMHKIKVVHEITDDTSGKTDPKAESRVCETKVAQDIVLVEPMDKVHEIKVQRECLKPDQNIHERLFNENKMAQKCMKTADERHEIQVVHETSKPEDKIHKFKDDNEIDHKSSTGLVYTETEVTEKTIKTTQERTFVPATLKVFSTIPEIELKLASPQLTNHNLKMQPVLDSVVDSRSNSGSPSESIQVHKLEIDTHRSVDVQENTNIPKSTDKIPENKSASECVNIPVYHHMSRVSSSTTLDTIHEAKGVTDTHKDLDTIPKVKGTLVSAADINKDFDKTGKDDDTSVSAMDTQSPVPSIVISDADSDKKDSIHSVLNCTTDPSKSAALIPKNNLTPAVTKQSCDNVQKHSARDYSDDNTKTSPPDISEDNACDNSRDASKHTEEETDTMDEERDEFNYSHSRRSSRSNSLLSPSFIQQYLAKRRYCSFLFFTFSLYFLMAFLCYLGCYQKILFLI